MLVPAAAKIFQQKPGGSVAGKIHAVGHPAALYKLGCLSNRGQADTRARFDCAARHPAIGTGEKASQSHPVKSTPVSYRLAPPCLVSIRAQFLKSLGYAAKDIQTYGRRVRHLRQAAQAKPRNQTGTAGLCYEPA